MRNYYLMKKTVTYNTISYNMIQYNAILTAPIETDVLGTVLLKIFLWEFPS